MQNLKCDTHERTYETNRITDIENRLVVANWEGVWGREEWEFGISRGSLLYKVLLQGTDYIHYPYDKIERK